MSSYQYRKSHCGDKTILWPSYLHNGISYTGKMTSLYWIRAQDSILVPVWVRYGMSFVSPKFDLCSVTAVLHTVLCLCLIMSLIYYHQTSNIRHNKSQNLNVSRLVVELSLLDPMKPVVKNKDVVGAAPTDDALTTSEWSKFYWLLKCGLY